MLYFKALMKGLSCSSEKHWLFFLTINKKILDLSHDENISCPFVQSAQHPPHTKAILLMNLYSEQFLKMN